MKKYFFGLLFILFIFLFYLNGRAVWHPVVVKIFGKKTVSEVIAVLDKKTEEKLSPLFSGNGISYPPKRLALVAFKDTRVLEVWGANADGAFKKIIEYPILGASGTLGPKLMEGDRQVPEGVYNVVGFNPNSSFHLSMKVNYPNTFDMKHAKAEGRYKPGSNIFIHGKKASVGCLAMGDLAIEELFTLVYKTGKDRVLIVISPSNPATGKLIPTAGSPVWVHDLYNKISAAYESISGLHINTMFEE